MAAAAFDTLQFVDTLKESGMPAPQAKAISVAMRNSYEIADLATKADLREVRLATKADLREVRLATKADLQEIRLATKADLGKLETTLHHEISQLQTTLHYEIGGLRKEIEAKQISMEAKQISMEAKLNSLGPQITIRITGIFFSLMAFFPYIAKLLHLPTP